MSEADGTSGWIADRVQMAARELMARILRAKALHYRRVFLGEDGVTPSRDGERVLADLKRFTRADQSTFSSDPYQAARLNGRREVWLRIAGYLNLDDAQTRKLVEVESDYD